MKALAYKRAIIDLASRIDSRLQEFGERIVRTGARIIWRGFDHMEARLSAAIQQPRTCSGGGSRLPTTSDAPKTLNMLL